MNNIPAFNRNFGKWFANDVIRAIKRYGLIEQGEQIGVAISGGKDSSVLLYVLEYLRRYSSLRFNLVAVHVKTADYNTGILAGLCERMNIPYLETSLKRMPGERIKNHCYVCARLKRGALQSLLSARGITKVALGHHATDVAETFLMNIVEHKKLGSFCPCVAVENSRMMIIRPLVYLDEATIVRIHRHAGLPLLSYECPYTDKNLRCRYKERLKDIERSLGLKDFAGKIVTSLENVDASNSWQAVRKIAD
jgi:tRNA 2-thiocytidine biosynthesis protein TtcA